MTDHAQMRQAVGARLKELRKARGFTQDEVARRTGIDQRHISKLESGTYDPRLSTIVRIAEALGARIHIRHPDQPHTDSTSKEQP